MVIYVVILSKRDMILTLRSSLPRPLDSGYPLLWYFWRQFLFWNFENRIRSQKVMSIWTSWKYFCIFWEFPKNPENFEIFRDFHFLGKVILLQKNLEIWKSPLFEKYYFFREIIITFPFFNRFRKFWLFKYAPLMFKYHSCESHAVKIKNKKVF